MESDNDESNVEQIENKESSSILDEIMDLISKLIDKIFELFKSML